MNAGTGRRVFIDGVRDTARRRPHDTALCTPTGPVTYRELFARVDTAAAGLERPTPGLVVVRPRPTVESVVDYLAAMTAGHAVMVTADDVPTDVASFEPDIVLTGIDPTAGSAPQHRSGDDIHPDLALLLSTSGSTSAPKFVRLSGAALLANARAIQEYLAIGPSDVGITSLPLHYTYGLSVLHSHLLAGASVVLTDTSVVDPCTWRMIDDWGVTQLPLVPHSLAMLERGGQLRRRHPRLRAVTVAGGRLAPDHVVSWAQCGAELGWQLYVMYGQTEATARMAYLPPEDALLAPHTVGRAVPGGSLTIEPAEDPTEPTGDLDEVGEIVYRGPNVMMGYARHRADLARGHEVDALRTGDLGRVDTRTGYVEIVGRATRFVKPMSVRVDLDQLERRLAGAGVTAACAGTDDRIVVATIDEATDVDPLDVLTSLTGLPPGCCAVVVVDEFPRTAAGKIDYGAIDDLVPAPGADPTAAPAFDDADIARCVAEVLGVPEVRPDDSFVSLGGDSLSFVEVSIRLERRLGTLPDGWHLMTIDELRRATPGRRGGTRRRWAATDTSILIRAVSILAVVATHMQVVRIPGGAHLMLAVAGYNFARFQLPIADVGRRVAAGVRTAARVGLPASVWVAINMVVVGGYSLGTVLLVNDYTGSSMRTDGRWRYWFFEAFVKIVLAATVIVAIPALRRLERRAPYGFALGILAPLLVVRFELVRFGDPYNYGLRAHSVAWLFALGWLVHRSTSTTRRIATTLVVLIAVPGFWDMPGREMFVATGLVLLVWAREVAVPRSAVPVLGALAASSMWIYLFHPQVYPTLTDALPLGAAYLSTIVVTMAMGAVAARCSSWVESTIDRGIAARRQRRRPPSLDGASVEERTGTLR